MILNLLKRYPLVPLALLFIICIVSAIKCISVWHFPQKMFCIRKNKILIRIQVNEYKEGRWTRVSLSKVRLNVQFTFPVHSSLFGRSLAMFWTTVNCLLSPYFVIVTMQCFLCFKCFVSTTLVVILKYLPIKQSLHLEIA